MEILHKFKQNGYFTSELYHLLAKKKLVHGSDPIVPSEYSNEMKMTTQQRLQTLNSIEVDNIVTTSDRAKKIVLSFSPRIIVYQNYKPNDKIVTKFSVKNISKAPTFLNMAFKESSYFSVMPVGGQLLSRLAPGISVTFAVTFIPHLYEDYTHRVTFYTDTDQYVVPFIAMGPRPVFDFPNEVLIPKTPLKIDNFVMLSVHNTGYVPAGFTLQTRSPFSVHPKSAYLNQNERIDIRVGFNTMILGEASAILQAIFETGEIFHIQLKGSTHLARIELEKDTVRFLDTYNTMVRQITLKIENKSNHVLTYMCMKNSCVYHDFEEKVKLATLFSNLKDSEAAKNAKLVHYDVLTSEEHDRVYTRIFYDEIQSLVADESLQFQHRHFAITPIKGNLWPNKVNELTVTFHPKEIGDLNAIVYLDIDGVFDRIPLNLLGTSLPPDLQLNVETLDMDRVYINKLYNYEIVVMNKGHINGVIVYKEVPVLFGSRITCSPEMHCLRPGEKDMFVISFCNSNQGSYFEEINFIIRDTDVVLKLYLKGEVIYPSLMFSIPCLDFGNLSLGVPKTLELDVINESVVDVSASVKISSDGPEVSSMTLTDYAVSGKPKPQVPQWPREFHIEPCKVVIDPESRISIKVTLTTNLIRANQTSLEIELEKSDSPPIVLPVTYVAMVPVIKPAPEIKLIAFFIDFSYHHEIQINCNDIWGYFTLEEPEESTMEVEFGVTEGMIKPNTITILPVTIRTNVLGPQEFIVRMHLFGLSKPIEVCRITGCGVRPIVTCSPTALHWGQVKLLTKSQKVLTLLNDSPVVVNYKASLLNKDGRWQIHPAQGALEPESETELLFVLYLIDAATYTNKAVIQLENVKDILVPLSVTGTGTSIMVGDLRDRIFLGRNFIKIPLHHKVIMENCGTRLHTLEWSEHYKAPKNKVQTAAFFNLEPSKVFKMSAGEKLELEITGLSHKMTTIKEMWFLIGCVEGINKKELLLECEIEAEFVEPKIEVSSSIIELQYDFGPYSEYYKLTDIITVKNVSKLPLDFEMSVKSPFAIIKKQSTYKIPIEEDDLCCCICYNETDLNIQNIYSEMGRQSRTFIDHLTLKPVEPLRKGPLQFFQDIDKIKMAFNLTHSIEQRLEDQDVMKIQVLFDTTKHLTLKSRVYCDVMRLKFKGHKNKDAIKLIGKINFPNLFVLSPQVDFQCILNGSWESKTIKIQNNTPLLVCYRFQWKKCTIRSIILPELFNVESEIQTPTLTIESDALHVTLVDGSLDSRQDKVTEYEGIPKELAHTMETSSFDSEFDKEFIKARIIKKVTPMIDPLCESKFIWDGKLPKVSRQNRSNINEVFQLVPSLGLLKPNETQCVQVIFRPKRNINVKAILECEVLGGPSEAIIVTGQSSDLMYKLNAQKINFKIRSFHENASETLLISNIALLAFEYTTYLNEPKVENELKGTILDLIPSEKVLESEEKVELKVVVRPGVVGYFKRVFLLEIGHLPHIPIEVYGWGVIPQVYLTLPRPEIADLHPTTGYEAIPALSLEYLDAVKEFFSNNDSDHLHNTPRSEKCFEDPDFNIGWHICTPSDGYPSTVDIELAIERMLVVRYIRQKPELLIPYSTTSKMGPIPGFFTTPYVIDFGVVISGNTVHRTAEVINYGPITTKLHFAKGTFLPHWLSMKICGKLNPGERGKLEVVFSPTPVDFKELEQNVEISLNLEVPYSVTIPLTIKALCAVPFLTSTTSKINFGSVRCGDKIICSIPLKNVGKPTCIWYVTLRLKVPGTNPMMVLDNSGKYEPGEGGWLSVAFKPTMEMTYEGVLIFRFHMNPNKMTIPVTGQGIIPHVHIIGPNVNFPPTLPWAETTYLYFGFTNPCPFPVELIIAHTDEKWKEEEEVYQLLYRYYNKPDEMLVPAIKPGSGMPSEVIEFYENLSERVKMNIENEAAAAAKVHPVATTKAQPSARKRSKSPKSASKTPTPKDVSPRKFRTEAEIISDEIRQLKDNNVDPLHEATKVFDDALPEIETEKCMKGLIVFFHGTPCDEMSSKEMGYYSGKKLNIPTINIDFCIVEALCLCECPAKDIILGGIDESYDLAKRGARSDGLDEQAEDGINDTEDEFEIVWKKIQLLAMTKNVTTPRAKAVDKKRKKSPNSSVASHSALAKGSTTMFQLDLVQELLMEFFSQPKFNRGFVVDSLTSIILKNPPLLLTTVLKCKRYIRNVHLVLCQTDFSKWAQKYEETIREKDLIDESESKIYNATEIETIIESLEELDEEQFELAAPELKSIYIKYGLEARRKKYLDKRGNVPSTPAKSESKSVKDFASTLTVHESEAKKKNKKDELKGKPTPEYTMMNAKYNDYIKNTYENLINIANNWILDECDVGTPIYSLNGQVLVQKKSKKKSETHLNQVSEASFAERGFPLTLITCPCLKYKLALANFLSNAPFIKEALKTEEDPDILSSSLVRKEYTVLLPKVFPKIHHEDSLTWGYLDELPIKKCECNQLTDLNLLDDSTQDNVLNILSKWHCVCGKKVVSSQTSTSQLPIRSTSQLPIPLLSKVVSEESEEEIFYPEPKLLGKVRTSQSSGRIVLQPGDLVRCKYSFSPQIEGSFGVKRFVEVSGWPNSRVEINVNGICDLPRLDRRPKKMFDNFVRRTLEDKIYKITFLDDLKLFEFGPIFIGMNRIYEEEYSIDLKNCSLITADVDIEFLEDTTVFQIDKKNMRLEPGCRDKLTISAAPAEIGVHRSTLLFCVKDNPEIVTVTIGCSGVVPIVEILPLNKTIDYGKLLLYRREDDRFIVKNDSVLPIMWKIPNASDLIEDFIIAQTSGKVSRHDNQVIPLTYIACNVGVISHAMLTIHIYDECGRGNPMIIDNLYLSAECYDVMVECAFENTAENLDYGNVKVNSTILREMYLLNRGKYNIFYRLKKVKNFPEPSLLKSFEASSEYGVVPPTLKLTTIEFECTPTTSINLVNVPAYTCSLLDGSKNQVVVAKFPVCVSIASFYNTFTLFPLGELNFHIIAVGSGVSRDVILNNTSKCPVTYEIVLPAEYQKDTHPSSVKMGKEHRIKNPPLKCGNFVIMNEDNLLAPGTSRTIKIQFLASEARKFEETIKFIISDTCPAEAQGVPLRLVGTGAMPSLDLWNLETTFREHLIVQSLSEYKTRSSSAHCVFEENSVTFHFFGVNVNSRFTGSIDLYNNGLVASALTMKLHYQSNSNNRIFSLDKYQTHTEPLMHKRLGIIFSPKALEEYRAVLEIKLKLLDNREQSFKICLIGEGVIPRIRLLLPQIRQHRIALLSFPVTCLGSISTRPIRFKNISSVGAYINLDVMQQICEERPIFWLTVTDSCEDLLKVGSNDDENTYIQVYTKPNDKATVVVHYNPIEKGKINCDVKLTILENPYEYFTILCEAESFMEDVILIGLEMLSMDIDLDAFKTQDGTISMGSTTDSKKKPKSAPVEKKKPKGSDAKKSRRVSIGSASSNVEASLLKYVLDFGGCELGSIQKRSVIMLNNSEKVYKFLWDEVDALYIVVKPSAGYISPGEEKDFEIMFNAGHPVCIQKEFLKCQLTAINDDSLTVDLKEGTWDNRQIVTLFDHNRNVSLNERCELSVDEQGITEKFLGSNTIIVVYSAKTSYTKYTCSLKERIVLKDTFIYQTRNFEFEVENVGIVPMKIVWSFAIEEDYPVRIDKYRSRKSKIIEETDNDNDLASEQSAESGEEAKPSLTDNNRNESSSKLTLFSGCSDRKSVDTWFERDLPFQIEPVKECLKPGEKITFKVTFAPLEAFDFRVALKSNIDNLDPYDQNASCHITAKSLVPYVHLDIEESDYLTSGRRKETEIALPQFMTILEFNVLGWGCYKKSFNVINPTNEPYEFIFELVMAEDNPELIPMHCDMLKGYVEGGTSTEVTFTFSPTAPGVYESQWKFIIPIYKLIINLLVVGIVREPEVLFRPTILVIRNSLVGFTTTNTINLSNNENEPLSFEFKGNSLCNESGKTPIILEPEQGVLKPRTETAIKLNYTPIQDGPLSFKLFCSIAFLTKYLTLCVNALSHSIKPTVSYSLIGNEHVLNADAETHIHLDQTASTYQRTVTFTIKNDGSATFFFNWIHNTSGVKKYLQLCVEPKNGHVAPGNAVECILYFTLKQVPVRAFPMTLSISDGPDYNMFIHAEIEKPLYHFSCTSFSFDKCFINAPDNTYKRNIAFVNDDKVPIIIDSDFLPVPELFVDFKKVPHIKPGQRMKIPIYFKPKQVREYEFELLFWVNSLCKEVITIKGEGIPLLFDLYEGCQKSFDLGPVKVGENIIRTIEVMNYSKIPIEASFIFRDMYNSVERGTNSEANSGCLSPRTVQMTPDQGIPRVQMLQQHKTDIVREEMSMDIENALKSLKVVPNKCTINPYRKAPLRIQFKPVGMISDLEVQLNMKVLSFERPVVKLSGSATGMSFCFSQNSLQFGRVRKRGCKTLKVMLLNKGDFGARFWWQPLISDEFAISPMKGHVAARSNVAFTLTFRPRNHNPFIKVWASCNIEHYKPLELALYATCVDIGNVTKHTLHLECPVREVATEYIAVTNPSDEMWLVLSEISGGPFETPREFNIEPNSTFEIPVHFKPNSIGKHEAQVLYSPIGESALFVTLTAIADHPNPNGHIQTSVPAKEIHIEKLPVYNITEQPESYAVSTEILQVIPDKFEGHYDVNHPKVIKTWGEAVATCRWEFVCYEPCQIHLKVMFINQLTKEYQFYQITVTVTASAIVDTLPFVSRARETVQKELIIKNPLNYEADFQIRCDKLSCPDEVTIGRNSEALIVMKFSPLVVGESEDVLEVINSDVGSFKYKIILKCLPAKEKDVEVCAPLGTMIPLRMRVHNKTEYRAEFIPKISHTSIQEERDYVLGPFEKRNFLVWFEPTELGIQKCRLSFDSPVAGEFVFNINGKGEDPKPQGPYEITAGGFTSIKFKNIFDDPRMFKINVDREEFYVKTSFESIKSKKDVNILVYLRDPTGWPVMPSGSLTVETYDPADPKVHWTYFLQGV